MPFVPPSRNKILWLLRKFILLSRTVFLVEVVPIPPLQSVESGIQGLSGLVSALDVPDLGFQEM